jgi:TRAP-type C4-dicarboxylate transport system permease small subunit
MARFALIAVTFLGAGCASARGEHLGAFFLRDRVRGRAKAVMLILGNLVCLLFEFFIIAGCFKMYIVTDHIMAVTVPYFKFNWMYIIIGLGAAMMFLCSCIDFIHSFAVFASGDTDGLPTGVSSPFMSQE